MCTYVYGCVGIYTIDKKQARKRTPNLHLINSTPNTNKHEGVRPSTGPAPMAKVTRLC
jgi:hypothetical protein